MRLEHTDQFLLSGYTFALHHPPSRLADDVLYLRHKRRQLLRQPSGHTGGLSLELLPNLLCLFQNRLTHGQ